MRIAILAHTRFPIAEPYAGGMEMITHLLAKELIDRGHDLNLFALSGSDTTLGLVPIDKFGEDGNDLPDGIDLESNRAQQLLITNAMLLLSKMDFDIVHNHTQHYLPLVFGDSLSCPLLTTFHTPAFEYLQYGIKFAALQQQAKYTAVSHSLGKTYTSLGILPSIVHNGIDVERWIFNPEVNGSDLIWFGRICPEKAPHLAIKTALIMGLHIYIAGPVGDRDYFTTKIFPHLNHKLVTYVDHLNHRDLNHLIGLCKVCLFTSIWEEPYGLAIAESLACGTPVVASNCGAAPEIIDATCGVLVPPQDIEYLVLGIKTAWKIDRALCRKRAQDHCDYNVMVDRYEALYAEMTVGELNLEATRL